MDEVTRQRAKKALKKQLKAANWNLQDYDSSQDIEMMVYCYDHFDTRQMMLAGLRQSDINQLAKFKQPMDVVATAVDGAFIDYAQSKSEAIQRKRTEVLGMLSGLYAINTNTYQKLLATQKAEGMFRHFVILLYRNKHTKECNLRPFSLVSDKSILSQVDIEKAAIPVIKRDEEMNPQFFHSSPVIRMK